MLLLSLLLFCGSHTTQRKRQGEEKKKIYFLQHLECQGELSVRACDAFNPADKCNCKKKKTTGWKKKERTGDCRGASPQLLYTLLSDCTVANKSRVWETHTHTHKNTVRKKCHCFFRISPKIAMWSYSGVICSGAECHITSSFYPDLHAPAGMLEHVNPRIDQNWTTPPVGDFRKRLQIAWNMLQMNANLVM